VYRFADGPPRKCQFVLMAQTAEGKSGDDERARPVWKDHNLHIVFGVTLMTVLGASSVRRPCRKLLTSWAHRPGKVGS
jgi:hypothetical protein